MKWGEPTVIMMAINLAWLVCFTIWQAVRSSDKELRTTVGLQGDRLTKVEAQLEALPNMRDVGDVYAKIGEVEDELSGIGATVGEIAGTVKALEKSVGLLMKHHIPTGEGK